MKKKIAVFVMIVITTVLLGRFSLGITVGLPGKITAQYQFTEKFGINTSTAVLLNPVLLFYNVNADLLFYIPGLLKKENQGLNGYWGLGAGYSYTLFNDENWLSTRLPLGIVAPFEFEQGHQIDAFLEIVPILFVKPSLAFSFTTSIGARYVF